MKSTELYTALEIMARREFRESVRFNRPWERKTRKERSQAFHRLWQLSVFWAAAELQIGLRDEVVLEMQRMVPSGMRANWGLDPVEDHSEIEVIRVGATEAPAPSDANGLQ